MLYNWYSINRYKQINCLLTVGTIISVWDYNSHFSTKGYFTIFWFITGIMNFMNLFTLQSQIIVQVWYWSWWHFYFSNLRIELKNRSNLWLVNIQSYPTALVYKKAVARLIFRWIVSLPRHRTAFPIQLMLHFLSVHLSYKDLKFKPAKTFRSNSRDISGISF